MSDTKVDEATPLEPCPFCGGKAESSFTCSEDGGIYIDRWAINCGTCNFEMVEMAVDGDSPWYKTAMERTAAKWNHRVNDSLVAQNEKLKRALESIRDGGHAVGRWCPQELDCNAGCDCHVSAAQAALKGE